MTEDRLLIEELAAKGGQPDFLRTIAENVLQLIMEADVDGLIGAGRTELLRLIYGADPADSGQVAIGTPPVPVRVRSPAEAVRHGLPEQCHRQRGWLRQGAAGALHRLQILRGGLSLRCHGGGGERGGARC